MLYVETKYIYNPVSKEFLPGEACINCQNQQKMEMQFYQEHRDNIFIKNASKIITATAYCSHCGKYTPVEKWTPSLEQNFKDLKKTITLNTYWKIGKSAYWIFFIFAATIIIGIGIFSYSNNINKNRVKAIETATQLAKMPLVNDIYMICAIDSKNTDGKIIQMIPYKIITVLANEIIAIPHKQPSTEINAVFNDFDLSPNYFDATQPVTIKKTGLYPNLVWMKPKDVYATCTIKNILRK